MYEIKDEPLSGVDCGAGAFMNTCGGELLSVTGSAPCRSEERRVGKEC